MKVKKIFNEQLIISKFFLNLKIVLESIDYINKKPGKLKPGLIQKIFAMLKILTYLIIIIIFVNDISLVISL